MKHLSRFFLVSLFVLSLGTMQAQDKNNPWALGVGANFVDYYPVNEDAPRGSWFSQFYNVGAHWNVLPSVSRLTVSRYIGDGFIGEIGITVNEIEHFGDREVNDFSYYAADASLNYSLRDLITKPLLNIDWFEPFLGVGGGVTWLEDEGEPTLNGTYGWNIWFTDNIVFNFQTSYKHIFDEERTGVAEGPDPLSGSGVVHDRHFQHAAGIKFVFGGKDTDGDGIYDKNDACPETPGIPEFNGCPDSDGDGIQDSQDACPNTPGLAEFDGCPDTDGDGIPDPKDKCPNTPGLAQFDGCPDSDGDGVADPQDNCPEVAGPAANDGCPWPDSDGDGVPDKDDKCPEVAGDADNEGCPVVTAVIVAELNNYSKTVLFDLDKASIRSESQDALNSIAEIMKEYPNSNFHIEGHTDSTGSASYNLQLSKERAKSVMDYLVSKGISADRLSSEGYGQTRPIAPNNTAKGRQLNRRVEISLETENVSELEVD